MCIQIILHGAQVIGEGLECRLCVVWCVIDSFTLPPPGNPIPGSVIKSGGRTRDVKETFLFPDERWPAGQGFRIGFSRSAWPQLETSQTVKAPVHFGPGEILRASGLSNPFPVDGQNQRVLTGSLDNALPKQANGCSPICRIRKATFASRSNRITIGRPSSVVR